MGDCLQERLSQVMCMHSQNLLLTWRTHPFIALIKTEGPLFCHHGQVVSALCEWVCHITLKLITAHRETDNDYLPLGNLFDGVCLAVGKERLTQLLVFIVAVHFTEQAMLLSTEGTMAGNVGERSKCKHQGRRHVKDCHRVRRDSHNTIP